MLHALLYNVPSAPRVADRASFHGAVVEHLLHRFQPFSFPHSLIGDTCIVDDERGAFIYAVRQHRDPVLAMDGGNCQMPVAVEDARTLAFRGCGEGLRSAEEGACYAPVVIHLADPEVPPEGVGEVPVVTGEFVGHSTGKAGGAENVDGARGGVAVPDDAVHPHEMVHVGMADEDRIDGGVDPFGEVVDLAAVEENGAAGGAHPDQQQRVVEQPCEERRLQVAEWFGHAQNFTIRLTCINCTTL